MPLAPGIRLGPYEIVAPIGAGGMGEVYRARDSRLGRDVAIKVLPQAFAGDPDRLRRLDLEARAAGMLNHPNILAIYDIGSHDGAPYIVSELLEGETLRRRLEGGPLPLRKAIDYALQTAQGLAAAHRKGIVHRDLKPENLFLTNDGRLKILDFGLAKLAQEDLHSAATESFGTDPGAVMGTAGYMSPEQVRGIPVDPRSDIFSFGAVLYEMLAGNRPFHGESTVETMHNILKAEPPEIAALPLALDRLLRHCLEKDPALRFQTAQDLAFALESVTVAGQTGPVQVASTPKPSRMRPWVWVLPAVFVLAAAGYWIGLVRGDSSGRQAVPVFQRLTFRRGNIGVARFTADGQTAVYSAAWENKPPELFASRVDSNESRALGIGELGLAAISNSGEMIVTRKNGVLARVPLAGGAPRDFADRSIIADWAPDGNTLAIVTRAKGKSLIEYPVGKFLAEIPNSVRSMRFSPKGDLLALVEMPPDTGSEGFITLIDLNGNRRMLVHAGRLPGLAWAPGGNEIWFSAGHGGAPDTLYAVDLAGKTRLLARIPGVLSLQDLSRDGVVLAESDTQRISLMCQPTGESKERDFSWLDNSVLNQISGDGKTLLFTEGGSGGGAGGTIYMRSVDGSAAVRLGEGRGKALSPDGKWVLAAQGVPAQLVLLPTGPGAVRTLDRGDIEGIRDALWFPDGVRILFAGRARGHDWQLFMQDVAGGRPRAASPESIPLGPLSPDGRVVAIPFPPGKVALLNLETHEQRPAPMSEPDWVPLRWTPDGRSLFIARILENTVRVERLNLATGARQPWKEISPIDPDVLGPLIRNLDITPDGKTYAYSYSRTFSSLYLIKGLK